MTHINKYAFTFGLLCIGLGNFVWAASLALHGGPPRSAEVTARAGQARDVNDTALWATRGRVNILGVAVDVPSDVRREAVRGVTCGTAANCGPAAGRARVPRGLRQASGLASLSNSVSRSAMGAFHSITLDAQSIAEGPEPRSIVLLGSSLLVICGFFRRRFGRPGSSTK